MSDGSRKNDAACRITLQAVKKYACITASDYITVMI